IELWRVGRAGNREHDKRADIKEDKRGHELLEFDAHDRGRGAEQDQPEQELIEIKLRVLGKMTGELAKRSPLESAGIDRERLDNIAAASLEQNDGDDHQRQAQPDGPPVLFQIKFAPAPALAL